MTFFFSCFFFSHPFFEGLKSKQHKSQKIHLRPRIELTSSNPIKLVTKRHVAPLQRVYSYPRRVGTRTWLCALRPSLHVKACGWGVSNIFHVLIFIQLFFFFFVSVLTLTFLELEPTREIFFLIFVAHKRWKK